MARRRAAIHGAQIARELVAVMRRDVRTMEVMALRYADERQRS
jgi:hypothetical protein